MIDINLIRKTPDVVRENIRKKFQDSKLPLVDEVIELDRKNREAMQQAGVPVGIVARIACDGTQYEIGREESSQISLRIVDGKVAFREADDKGFIPVNTIAELKMIDLDDASRGRKYLQQGNIDLLDAEWTPISKLVGI